MCDLQTKSLVLSGYGISHLCNIYEWYNQLSIQLLIRGFLRREKNCIGLELIANLIHPFAKSLLQNGFQSFQRIIDFNNRLQINDLFKFNFSSKENVILYHHNIKEVLTPVDDTFQAYILGIEDSTNSLHHVDHCSLGFITTPADFEPALLDYYDFDINYDFYNDINLKQAYTDYPNPSSLPKIEYSALSIVPITSRVTAIYLSTHLENSLPKNTLINVHKIEVDYKFPCIDMIEMMLTKLDTDTYLVRWSALFYKINTVSIINVKDRNLYVVWSKPKCSKCRNYWKQHQSCNSKGFGMQIGHYKHHIPIYWSYCVGCFEIE